MEIQQPKEPSAKQAQNWVPLSDIRELIDEYDECVRRAQEARLQSLAMQLAESDCTLRVTNTHLCSADSARAKEK